jgi:hypothetical protein
MIEDDDGRHRQMIARRRGRTPADGSILGGIVASDASDDDVTAKSSSSMAQTAP